MLKEGGEGRRGPITDNPNFRSLIWEIGTGHALVFCLGRHWGQRCLLGGCRAESCGKAGLAFGCGRVYRCPETGLPIIHGAAYLGLRCLQLL